MKRLLLLAPLLFATQALSQVSYTGGVYSQNFDSLPGTTNNTLNSTWTDNSTLPGWYANKTTFSVTDGTVGGTAATFDSTTTTANNVGLFSFGTAASTDRALGVRATSNFAGNDPVLHGVRLVNNTSQTLTKFTITYTGEQWFKSSVATGHTLLLDYQLGASSISAGTWTAASAGTFTAPIATGTTATALNGNTTANRTVKVAVVTGVSWAPGQELWVRFRDANESGNEQGLAVDDFSFLADNESALFYNGSTSYVTMGFGSASATAFGASDFTLECRFLRTGAGATASTGNGGVTAVPLIAKGVGEAENSNIDANYFLGIDANGKLTADFEQFSATNNGTAYAAGQNFPITGTTTLQNGVWYHVAATYNTSTATWKLYVNGVEETTTTVLATFAGVVPRSDSIQGLGIGTTLNSTGARAGFFQGIIDEARIWNVTRTQSQIANNKDAKIISGQSGMLARFGFDEATGTTAAGTKADGSATTSGTLSGTTLPQWVNAKAFVANAVPTVSITAPVNGASVMAPATVSITANAADSDGTIAKVEFFNGATKIGEDLTSPYQFDWSRTNADTGTFSLTAIATDNGGSSTTSTAVSLTITPNSNQPPVITLSSPANNATGIGSSTTISASIADPEGDAQTVTFYGRMTAPSTPGADFTIATLPDTQFYSENLNNNNRAATYHAQTQWLVDNRDSLNLAFVSHMGDIVQNGDAVPAEWLVADAAMQRIENQTGTLRAHGIPWGGAPGNHDQTSIGNAGGANAFYNQYFGTSRFIGRRYWGGSQSVANNNNNYQLFSASGLDFIILHLEYDTRAVTNYQAVMDWADAVMKAYPNRRAIVTSHWIVDTGNPAPFSTQGQNLYNDLKDNPNFFMMLCGHVAGEGQRSDTFQGRTVYSILQDYQSRTNGGDGWLRYFIFSPANNTISARTYRVSNPVNPAAGSIETDADSQFTLNYNMQNSQTDWIPLGTVNVAASGTTASLNWTGLTAGKDYEWYATANDGTSVATSSTRRFTTAANTAPTVAITAPVNNASYTAPGAFTLTADASGSIARVEFYQGGTKLGEDTTAPYEQSVSGLLVGSYSFTAVAVDTSGQATLSAVVNVTMNASLPPTVALTAPTSGASFDALATINLTADASDSDGTVTLVEFFNGATKLGEDATAPYSLSWTGVITGSYSLTAKATDNANTTASSAAATVTVTNVDNVAPSVAITAPANNSSVSPAVPLTLNATAGDTDGTISKVEFFDGASLLGEDTTAPYSFTIATLTAGAHAFTAKATDNDGGTTTSSTSNVTGDPALWAYSQNFDGMAGGTAPPSGWSFYGVFGGANSTYTDSIAIPASAVGGGTLNNTLIASTTIPATTASSNTQGYNFALAASSSDRALGTSATTGQFIALQLSVTNTSGAEINAVRLGYDIRRFTSVATANELPGYFVFYSLDNGTTWNATTALNPSIATVPNTVGVTTMGPTTITLPSAWTSGATLLLRWIDDNAVATSPDQIYGLDNVSLTLPIGQPPVATLTEPASGLVSYVGDTISLAATASDADGTIAKVEFYQGSTKLGEDTSAPYAFDWTGFTAGAYSLTARAIDNDGNTTSSSAVSVTVSAAPGSGTLTRSPYLNQANQNSIVVRWRTSQAVVGRVRYGTVSGSLTQFTDESSAKTDHEVKLTGLTPYTRYYYSVGSSFDTLTPEAADTTSVKTGNTGSPSYTFPTPTAADYTFRTSPTPGTATNTRIWVVGDCGRGSATQAGGRNAYYNWMGSRLPDLNLQLGDNAYNSGTDTEYQSGYYLMYPTVFRKMPQWSTLGNHDANNGTTTATTNFPYFDMFTFPTAGECGGVSSGTEHYYSFDYGNIHFICLDSQTTLANNSPTAPQTVWLQNDLASTTATWIIAFFHHPPYSKGSHNSDSEAQMMTMRQVYNPILEAGGVDLVLTGHSHNYERSVLLDGHYGLSSTITSAMKKNAGNGSTTGFTTAFTIAGDSGKIRNAANGFTATATVNGAVIPADGAYIKPLLGSRANFGAVYNTAGMSGQADGGAIDHTAMYISYDTVGTVNLDIDGNTLTATFVQADGNTPDNYTIIKQGGSTAPVATTSPATNVGATTATLNASINPTGTHSTAKFQVGTTTSYGTDLPVTLTPDDDVVSQAVSLNLTDLTPGTTYYYRASATNTNGTTNGAEATFTTLQNNANLAGLGISTGTLSPPFTPATTSYSLNVANATTSVTVTPVSATATLQVRVNGGAYASVTSGTASADLALNVNANPIEIKVTAQDGTVKTYTVTVTRATLFTEWAPLQGLPPASAAPTADADGDGVSNLVEYAFGLNPTSTDSTPLTVTAGGAITARGTPVTTVASTPTAVDFRAAHVRRKDAAAAGLTYTVQFSAGDGSWTSSTATPTVVASDSEVEVVTVKYPLFLNGKKARFFRVVVSAP